MHDVPTASASLSSSSSSSSSQRGGRSGDGDRLRKVSKMNSSERSKHYRQLRAKAAADLHAETQRLRDEVAWAERTLELHRRLTPSIAPDVRKRAVESLRKFVTEHVMAETFGLVNARRALDSLEVLYGGPPSPILRLRYAIQGRLHALAVEKLYPFVVGNTLALACMLHDDVELDYQFTVFFDAKGRIERVEIDRGELLALSWPLFGLATAACILVEVPATRSRGAAEYGQHSPELAGNSHKPTCVAAIHAPTTNSESCREHIIETEGRRNSCSHPQTRVRPTWGFPYVATD